MNDMTLYYDYIDNMKVPMWLVVENFEWEGRTLYLPITSNFSTGDMDNFEGDELSVSVLISDLILNSTLDDHFGINLENVESRINNQGYSQEDITKLVVRVEDVKEVFYMDRVNLS
ncbi:hypothetical protein [Gracilibacillus sp. YIM 98692]|uniref:hypothetical protein n=1 Tax=Gracilibacillus sp. YIM 98692 TaxID=2663532 RepID=UPI0013D56C16|nr:hypothetical protein [Gracilibacillus sp. YIM 98692]